MTTIRQFYETRVNALWPDGLPKLTAEEARRAARRLYRFVMKRKCPYPIVATKGNRYSYIRAVGRRGWQTKRKTSLVVNYERGWQAMVHELSHTFFRRLRPGDKPHDRPHAGLEASMIQYVLDHGWLDGKLAAKPKATVDVRTKRKQQTLDGIARWETKLKRANNALKKLRRRLAYYERTTP